MTQECGGFGQISISSTSVGALLGDSVTGETLGWTGEMVGVTGEVVGVTGAAVGSTGEVLG